MVNSQILPILTLILVTMTTSLESSQKGVKSAIYDHMPTNGENLVKIGLVDPEILFAQTFI